jgi:hypothetical protein
MKTKHTFPPPGLDRRPSGANLFTTLRVLSAGAFWYINYKLKK